MKQTGGNWDPTQWPIYFRASDNDALRYDIIEPESHLLLAVTELPTRDNKDFEELLNSHVLLDSGVYVLATQHAHKHGMSMDEALRLAPNEIEGFDKLFDLYVQTVSAYQDRLWGYIEIDFGGCQNKRKTRARLEGLGLRPMPVYHPLNDGWDYFDELANEYDRICLGNIVLAPMETRKRILATIWERRRQYPHLWIHGLGMTPGDMNLAYMLNSFDSSTWLLAGVRYGRGIAHMIGRATNDLMDGFIYRRDKEPAEPAGYNKARQMASYNAILLDRSYRIIKSDLEQELGADVGLFDHDHGSLFESRLPPLAKRPAAPQVPQ